MGKLNMNEAMKGLAAALRFFRDYGNGISEVINWDIFKLYTLICVLATYLYSKYYKLGVKKGSSYEVVANTIKNVYIESDTDLAGYASGLILTRNLIAHLAYYPDTDTAVKEVIKDSNLFRLLQICSLLS